jgi:UDP-N-acetylglucosamine:LPS N-acetylglucosamine transferase
MEKYIKIHFAEAFIHLGTTLGFEACFTGTPSVIIDFDYFQQDKSLLSIKNFVHQYQNEKYLLLKNYPNVVHSEKELLQLLQELLQNKIKYLAYNKAVRDTTPLRKFEQFAGQLIYN